MVKGELVELVNVARKVGLYDESLRAELRRTVQRLTIELQGYVKAEKLSGQVLKNRTGTLRRSINQRVEETEHGVVGYVGTNVVYARRHEYGYQGPEDVKAHLRLVKEAFGRELKHPVWVQVNAHTRQVNLPERSFLRSALADKQDRIKQELSNALQRAKKS